jgi:hypothetical protein
MTIQRRLLRNFLRLNSERHYYQHTLSMINRAHNAGLPVYITEKRAKRNLRNLDFYKKKTGRARKQYLANRIRARYGIINY